MRSEPCDRRVRLCHPVLERRPCRGGVKIESGAKEVEDAITDALRDETPLASDRLEALRTFTLAVVRGRGNVDDTAVKSFLDAGFTLSLKLTKLRLNPIAILDQ